MAMTAFIARYRRLALPRGRAGSNVPGMSISKGRAAANAVLFSILAIGGCGGARTDRSVERDTPIGLTPVAALEVTSDAFAAGDSIPVAYTCEGEDHSPRLAWRGVPGAARSLALICDDPDAPSGTWTHWIVYGLPPSTTELAEGAGAPSGGAPGAAQGTNDFERVGYGGPCPPPGDPHHYFFRVYALDRALDLKPGATRAELMNAIARHVIAQGELMGTYRRKR
jgi:Raf kinase inhibitor-like YbhB/YbcL family protein